MSKKLKKNVPQLRFPGFEGDWEIATVDDIALVSSGGTPSRTEPTYWNGDIPWITTSEISQFEIFDSTEKITRKGLDNSSAKLFPKDTILLAMYGQGKTRGQVAILRIESTTNQACAAIIPKSSYKSEFIYYFLFKEYDNLRNLSNDGSQQNLSAALIKQYKIPITRKAEQEKIASFLGAVDTRLNQLRRKRELLQTYKRGVMRQIFAHKIGARKEKKTPELRFSGFKGNWKARRLGDFLAGRYTSASEHVPLFSLTIENGVTEKTERYERSFLVKDEEEAYKLVKPNDFVYNPMNLRFGALAKHKREHSVKVSKYYDVFSADESVNLFFIEFLLKNNNSIQYYNHMAEGSLIEKKRLHFADFLEFQFLLPSLEEQEKIVDFLTAIDRKIEAISQQIEKCERFKQGLLQKLFV